MKTIKGLNVSIVFVWKINFLLLLLNIALFASGELAIVVALVYIILYNLYKIESTKATIKLQDIEGV